MRDPRWRSSTVDLIASFGQFLPACDSCGARMAMSCREADKIKRFVYTFECRSCRFVVQRKKHRRSLAR